MNNELRILILEDSETDTELMLHELRKDGLQFNDKWVWTEDEFSRQLREFNPDLVLADYALPGFDGLIALSIAQKMLPDLPVIFVSGILGEETAVHALHQGAKDYILKNRLFQLPPAVRRAVDDVNEQKKRKEAELALRRSQENFYAILNNIPDAAWLKDKNNRFVAVNKAFLKACGKKEDEIINKTNFEIFSSELAKKNAVEDQEVLMTGQPKRVEEKLSNSTGGTVWMDKILTPIFDSEGKVTGMTGIIRDITKLKEAEEILLKKEAMEKEFAENIYHEFRTPLAAIRGFAGILKKGDFKDIERRERFADHIVKHVDWLNALIEDLLKLSVVESGHSSFEKEPLNLSDFMCEYTDRLSSLYIGKNISVECQVEPELKVLIGKNQLSEILQNLISNAVRYNREGGWIRVTAGREGNGIKFTVKDNGQGIETKDIPLVFDRFHITKRKQARELKDTGIGLHIVKRIVESVNGRIWVNSKEGKGTTFHFVLPAAMSGDSHN